MQCRVAYHIIVLKGSLEKFSKPALGVLASAARDGRAMIRARGLKSISVLLSNHPSTVRRIPQLDRLLVSSVTDSSSLVRNQALTLLPHCKPLDPLLVRNIACAYTRDSAVSIRKRAVAQLKEVYADIQGGSTQTDTERLTVASILL